MKKIILAVAYILQLHRIFRWINRNKTIILMYHGFTDKFQFHGIANYHRQNLHYSLFRKQVNYLKKHYRIVSLNEYLDTIKKKQKPPKYSVIITIDDGYKSNYIYAFPILKEIQAPATIFITTSFVDNKVPLWSDRLEFAINKTNKPQLILEFFKEPLLLNNRENKIECDKKVKAALKSLQQEQRDDIIEGIEKILESKLTIDEKTDILYQPLSWNEINEMLISGLISIGSHTHSHFILSRCNIETIEKEVRLSKNIIEHNTKTKCELFCYPNGKQGDFNETTKEYVMKAGYECALTTINGFNTLNTSLYELRRIGIGDEESMTEFIMKVSGVMSFLQKIKKIVNR